MNLPDQTILIQKLLDGSIETDELHQLEQIFRAHPEAIDAYIDMSEIHSFLGSKEAESAQYGTVVPMERIVRRQKRRQLKVAALAAAAIVLISLLSLQLFWFQSKSSDLAFSTSPQSRFTISNTNQKQRSDKTLSPGSTLTLSQGSLELTFATGVTSILVAPAEITLVSENTLKMPEGRAWFNVPKQAIGFKVITSELEITDLGTQFGVLADPKNHDEIHVFKGSVIAKATRGNQSESTLYQLDSRRASARGDLNIISTQPDAFLTALPNSLPNITWTFDEKKPFQASGSHPAAATIKTKATGKPTLTSGRFGQALLLNGKGQSLETNWKSFQGLRPRTISAWVYMDSTDDHSDNSAIVAWGDHSTPTGKWTLQVSQMSPESDRKLRVSMGNTWATTKANVPTDRWVHLAATTNGSIDTNGALHLELYIDGINQEYSRKGSFAPQKGTTVTTLKAAPVTIGSSIHSRRALRKFLKSKLDEVSIYDGHMSPEEIKDLAQP
ncbi:LamG-like jellyroll fold domain-containing protein [Rubritalea tangerina]|uniref:LamG-like jellyroll fold domain-containing protein n=1 Tax=Rubritalea tangerina TaxID=430798 RepID=A0ABW4Z9M6_9BACT